MTNTMGTSSTNDDRHFAYFYDANGNVGQLVDSDPSSQTFGSTQARYEYYPFGGILVPSETSAAAANPFKFSTKYRDKETSLYYYGYRYLIPRLGRWLNHDPLGEMGGVNLYAAMGNDPVGRIDPDGRCSILTACMGNQPPSSQPTSGPTSQPASQPTSTQPGCINDCQKSLATALGDPHVKAAIAELANLGCPAPQPTCVATTTGGGCEAGLLSNGTTAIQCYGKFSADALLHELIHLWQHCPKGGGHKWSTDSPMNVPCLEWQAVHCSGNGGDWKQRGAPNELTAEVADCASSVDEFCNLPANTQDCKRAGWIPANPSDKPPISRWALQRCYDASSNPDCACKGVPGSVR